MAAKKPQATKEEDMKKPDPCNRWVDLQKTRSEGEMSSTPTTNHQIREPHKQSAQKWTTTRVQATTMDDDQRQYPSH
jgi:hypothetical protein